MAAPRPWRTATPRHLLVVGVVTAGLLASACGGGASASGPPPAPPPSLGVVQDRKIPQVPLVDETGRPISLSAFRGKVVVLVPMLTLCQETCPITTGALLAMDRSIKAAGLSSKVTIVEFSVDPGRDTPARLVAYARMAGLDWPLLTGTEANLSTLWRFFGLYVQRVPEPVPPTIDWLTNQPLTYDVAHSDGFVLLDPSGHQRFITTAPPDVGGQLSPALRRLLGPQGQHNLVQPQQPAWTVPEGLSAVGWLVGRSIPLAG